MLLLRNAAGLAGEGVADGVEQRTLAGAVVAGHQEHRRRNIKGRMTQPLEVGDFEFRDAHGSLQVEGDIPRLLDDSVSVQLAGFLVFLLEHDDALVQQLENDALGFLGGESEARLQPGRVEHVLLGGDADGDLAQGVAGEALDADGFDFLELGLDNRCIQYLAAAVAVGRCDYAFFSIRSMMRAARL